MGQDSNIEWTHHTFNPWRGCTKVSDGCKHCYADTLSKRNPKSLGIWGPKGTRVVAAESAWRLPIKWDRWAREGICHVCGGSGLLKGPQGNAGLNKCSACNGVSPGPYRAGVFCASLADVFEGRDTMPAAALPDALAALGRIFDLIRQTPHLRWMLLTKRPENVVPHLQAVADYILAGAPQPIETLMMVLDWLGGKPPSNVWIGTSVEDQPTADKRIAEIIRVPAAVRFLSMEPLLGAVDISEHLWGREVPCGRCEKSVDCACGYETRSQNCEPSISWVIVGGESGCHARPMHPQWARDIRDQCVAAGVPFFFKQWGEYSPYAPCDGDAWCIVRDDGSTVPAESLPANRVNGLAAQGGWPMARVGKSAAGRLLDGREWNEMPAAVEAGR